MPRARRRAPASRARRIVCHPRILGGKPVIEGTRVSVEHVLGLIASGMSVEAIVESYPDINAADVRAAVGYAREALRDDIVVPVVR